MRTKYLSFALTMLISMASSVTSAHSFKKKGIYYNITSSSTVEVTYRGHDIDSYENEYTGSVTIPKSVTYNSKTYSVTSIGENAFKNCSILTSVTIPNSVTSIGSEAFFGCSGLYSVTIPNSMTSIGWSVFGYCSGLTSVTIPNSVTSIGDYAFYGCSGLTSVTIPNSVTDIGESAFGHCMGLTSVSIPNSVTSIGNSVFYGCSGLTSVSIPNNVTKIGSCAFENCSGLTSITIPNSVYYIDDYAFSDCSGLTSINIPNSVTIIGSGAFWGCSGLTSINIPDCVASIGYNAFHECSGLTSVTIPNSVKHISGNAFSGCSNLESIIVNSGNTVYDSREGCHAIIHTASNALIAGCKNTTIPNSVTSIGYEAFFACSGLTSIDIPNSVTSIGYQAFYGCSGLTSVTIPNNVAIIGKYAFSGCSGLESIVVNSGNTIYDSREGCNAIIETASNMLVAGCKNTTIPNSVTSIGNTAFEGSGLTSITVPNSVTSIEYDAFHNCSGLETIVVNSGNTVYDSREGCNAIIETASNTLIAGCKNTTIPNSVTSIGNTAFDGSGLTFITIPNSVTSIGYSAFYGCSGLTSIDIPNSVTSIGYQAFYGCSGLTSVTIPNSVVSIDTEAFSCCYGLTSITIPNSVMNIYSGAFEHCTGLTSITIGKNVKRIDYDVFSGCTKLTRINCCATIPPDCDLSCMEGVPLDCIIEVPVGCKAAYEAVSPWNLFTIVETEDPVETTIVTLAAEYGTFCSATALDFTDMEGVKAYIASAFDAETGQLTLTRVYNVKAGTGLILRGTKGETYEIPVGTGATTVSNLLVGVTEDTELEPIDGEFTNFILAKDAVKGIGFYRVASRSTLKGGKAYLQLPSDELSSEVKGFRMLFDDGDMSDNVETMNNSQFTIHNGAGAVYDLQGRRVAKPTKGIYIVNGKKTVIK